MADEKSFAVTLVKVGPGLPYFEVGAYKYVGEWLPRPGDTITIKRISDPHADAPDEVSGFVTRVDPAARTPISVTEVETAPTSPTDDYLVV